MPERAYPRVRVRHNVVCQSTRHGVRPVLIVIHDTEGANLPGIRDLQGLGDYFDRIATQASSHTANDAEGNSARFVMDEVKAWHVAYYNPWSLGVEQIGKVGEHWPDAQVRETARWVAEWSRKWGIPIRRAAVSGGRVTRSGVIRHMDLGSLGGGHHDPGADYPFAQLLTYARHYARLQNAHPRGAVEEAVNPGNYE